ncbi:RNA-binding motif protein, X-linked 2-like [Euwallacea similis]|uniref:RNA-binding motif protein, X-linked 2-like n=1 Tax=Euwallacea similis TaxID=1736056 RepID=UPI00344B6DEB
MNPLTNMKNVTKLSEQDLYKKSKSSWHDQYRDSAWIFVGGLPYDLTEGDIICVFSQYGEVVNINLIRAKETGNSKGYCFLCYEDQRSTVLAVDNFNGIKILNRTIRVDHVQNYKVPKEGKKTTEETRKLYDEGCAPKTVAPVVVKVEPPSTRENIRETLVDQIEQDIKLPARLPIYTNITNINPVQISEVNVEESSDNEKKEKKSSKKGKKKSKKRTSSFDDDSSSSSQSDVRPKKIKANKKDKDQKKQNGKSKNFWKGLSSKHLKSSHDKNSDYGSAKDDKDSKRSNDSQKIDRSMNQDTDSQPKVYKRDVSPNIPKRWR